MVTSRATLYTKKKRKHQNKIYCYLFFIQNTTNFDLYKVAICFPRHFFGERLLKLVNKKIPWTLGAKAPIKPVPKLTKNGQA